MIRFVMSGGNWVASCSTINGFLLDISGVLYDSGDDGGKAIPGSVDALDRLRKNNVPLRFCTNESQCSREEIAAKLQRFGFDLKSADIFPPAPAMAQILRKRNLRPHLLVHPDVLQEFGSLPHNDPNCVVVGDAADGFTKYYKHIDGLQLDVGAYMTALEYSSGVKAEVVGKPSQAFFHAAVEDMELRPDEVLMIGDDIVNDVGGGQAAGMRALQVRTGKYRKSDEPHPTVNPDGYVDNLAQAVDMYLSHK